MTHRSHTLTLLLQNIVHRVSPHVLVHSLPPKHEFVFVIKLSKLQQQLYQSVDAQPSFTGIFLLKSFMMFSSLPPPSLPPSLPSSLPPPSLHPSPPCVVSSQDVSSLFIF